MIKTARTVLTSRIVWGVAIAATVFVIIFVGVLASAWWNPVQRTDNLSVALVNEDAGYTMLKAAGGKTVQMGDSVADKLTAIRVDDRRLLDWHAVESRQAALEGLKAGDYEMAIIIPADFSERIATYGLSAAGLSKVVTNPADMEVIIDQANAPFDTTMLNTMGQQLVTKSSAMAGSQLVQQLRAGQAAGTARLAKGAKKVASGAKKLRTGTNKLRAGAIRLRSGVASANAGTGKLASGASALGSGAYALDSGLKKLVGGAGQAKSGAQNLLSGSAKLAAGANTAAANVSTAAAGASQVSNGSAGVVQLLQALAAQNPDLAKTPTFQQAMGAAQGTASGAANLASGLSSAKSGMASLAAGASSLHSGASKLSSGISSLAYGASAASGGAGKLVAGTQQLSSGVSRLSSGLAAGSGGAQNLTSGAAKLAAGSSALAAGSSALATGAGTAAARTSALTTGPAAEKLAQGLSSPITAVVTTVNTVDRYGKSVGLIFFMLFMTIAAVALTGATYMTTRKMRKDSRFPAGYVLGCWLGLLLPAVVVAVLCTAAIQIFGFSMESAWTSYGIMVLGLIAFVTLDLMLVAIFDVAGLPLAALLIPFQMAAGGAMMATGLTPGFYQALSQVFPYTYAISGLRLGMFAGGGAGDDAVALVVITAVCLAVALALCFLPQLVLRRRLQEVPVAPADAVAVS